MDTVIDQLPLYWEGFRMTLLLTFTSALLALLIGTFLGALRVSPIPSLRVVGTVYVEVLRNTPLTLVFFGLVFVAPQVGVTLPFLGSAIVALTLYTSAFVCEAVRSGVNGVPRGQAEAARSLGLTFGQSLRLVVLPQAMRSVVPPLISIFIALTKNTSVAGGFFVFELFGVAKRLSNQFPADAIPILIGVAAFYLLITVPSGALASRLEHRLAFAR